MQNVKFATSKCGGNIPQSTMISMINYPWSKYVKYKEIGNFSFNFKFNLIMFLILVFREFSHS